MSNRRSGGRRSSPPAALVALLIVSVCAAGTGRVVPDASASTSAQSLAFAPVADAYVDSQHQSRNYGRDASVIARSASPTQTSYLRFTVSGVLGSVTSAHLRLFVTDPSPSSGTVYPVSSTTWGERDITWQRAPSIGAGALASLGSTTQNTWVDVDLGTAIPDNGTYSFAIRGTSTNAAAFASRETTRAAQLLLTTGPSAPHSLSAPTISGTAEEISTLTAAPGSWAGYPTPTYAYQWMRCDAGGAACADIAGATGTTYALSFGDTATTMRVRVTATNEAGAISAQSEATTAIKAVSLALPVRAAFTYGWYPENWLAGMPYNPSLGLYDSGSTTVIKQHIKAMQYGGLQAGIYSWWGLNNTGNQSTQRFPSYLSAAEGTGFKWAVYYEQEGYGNPAPDAIAADLAYIRDNYATSKSYLRVAGRPVVFVYSGAGDGCDMADRWHAANTIGAHIVLDTTWVDNEPQLAAMTPYDPASTSAVRVAAADLAGDAKAEVVTVPGPGAPAQVNVLDATGTKILSFLADDSGSTAGAYVATGDLTGDGRAEIVVSLAGATPSIRVFTVATDGTVAQTASFDAGLGSAPTVAVGDVDGDGKGDIVAGTGAGMAPQVKVFSADGVPGATLAPYDASFTKGVHVAVGNVVGDARSEIILGSANGTRNEVRVVDTAGTTLVTPFAAYDAFGGAISVATADVTGDGRNDVVTGAAGGPRVRTFTLRLGRPSGLASFFAYGSATRGQIGVAAADVAGESTADIVVGSAAGQPAQAKVFGNVRDCASQPDEWHEYLVAGSGESTLGHDSYTVTPGFWSAGAASPALPREQDRWNANVQGMVASQADWQLVLSFNEWGEGTVVESAREWASPSGYGLYLDALHTATTPAGAAAAAAAPTTSTVLAPGPVSSAPASQFPLVPDHKKTKK
jgi:hypothetical protein